MSNLQKMLFKRFRTVTVIMAKSAFGIARDKRSMHSATLEDIRRTAARVCGDYLNGRWKEVSADQLIVKRISGGLSNYLYYVSLPPAVTDGVGLTTECADGGDDVSREDIDLPSAGYSKPQISATIGESCLTTTTTATTPIRAIAQNDVNSNELVSRVLFGDDFNANIKRKRYDSSSSAISLPQRQSEPQEVLLRIYGQSHGEDALEAMITESVVFALLSERNFGPKLHGIFPGGRIEQYIPARALSTLELADARISCKIAEKMGEIHSLNIPMSKEPDWLWNCIQRWQSQLPAILNRNDWHGNQCHAEFVGEFNFIEEALWIKSIISMTNYPVLFCHNDLQEGNILMRHDKASNERTSLRDSLSSLRSHLEDSVLENASDSMIANNTNILKTKRSKITDHNDKNCSANLNCSIDSDRCNLAAPDLIIIDFEYCAYNYRGFDLANHFLEWTFDYSNSEFPFFHHHKDQYPSKLQRDQFIRVYLKKLNDFDDDYEAAQEDVESVEREIELFSMLSHLFWGLWSVVNTTSNIEFGYWDYAVTRIKEYQQLKQEFNSSIVCKEKQPSCKEHEIF
ncbi:choline kinase alpha isoform X1 [Glossina fuscipes]|uniref:Choline kinase alpha isoform X1 n=1 Tax=Glossina fuscipes TaxID=7396 RepID=A0A8U0WC62_9MUSC|nr:choline kinase alpha isoform X1 [Glossina fuscipes]XP_037882965.1 choline kinase alpha isoform X1 [Glossina fuscipes]